jgi:DnaJ-class molecular chaperone
MNRSGEMSLAMARRVLGVGEKASPDEIRSAYRAAVKTAHPDHGGTAEELRLTLEAWRVLEGKPAPSQAEAETSGPTVNRLEITPVIAVVGGRMITRLPDGRKAAITLPPGLRAGDKIMASGVRLTITIKGRPDMFVSGDDLCMSIKASPSVFRDGGQLKIKTPTGSRMVWISTVGANNIVRINGQGLPATSRHKQGALLLKLIPDKGAKEPKRRRAA